MTAAMIPGLDQAPVRHRGLLEWVREVAELTTPDRVIWCDGSDDEWRRLTTALVRAGTFMRLRHKPNSFWCACDPSDAARTDGRTFLCSQKESDAGPTNNWMAPAAMRTILTETFNGCMRGRTMYVIPFCMGPLSSEKPALGVEITDSEYVVVSMHIMTRMGAGVLPRFCEDADFVRCLHSVGAPRQVNQPDVPWPCNDTKYLVHFPETREIWSYGSGNALSGKESYALRIASVIAREEGWLAEHMAILKVTSPDSIAHYVAAAFPDSCGKTNLAMLEPAIPGWTVQTLGDAIAWLRFGADGRLYAINPEYGFFGVAPGTAATTNPIAMHALAQGNSLFTNTALTDDGDIWWEGMGRPPAHLTAWTGRDWWPDSHELAAHPNARYTTPITQCPTLAPEWDDPAGVPISAIIFAGRRASTVPLVTHARDWQHGVFLAATLASETAADAFGGSVGVPRRDPMAMRPFLGYHLADYLRHWLDTGARADPALLPEIFLVNWFRRGNDGRLLWPGHGENSRILKWIIERVDGTATAADTPIGYVPTAAALDRSGLGTPTEDIHAALLVDQDEWRAELSRIHEWFITIGTALPVELRGELNKLTNRITQPSDR